MVHVAQGTVLADTFRISCGIRGATCLRFYLRAGEKKARSRGVPHFGDHGMAYSALKGKTMNSPCI